MSNKKHNHDDSLPNQSPIPLIRQYESEFTREFHNSLSAALADVLKYVAKVTADTIKNGLVIKSDVDLDIEKAHQVGEIHSNGKWVWTEYSPGKFDWRTIVKASSAKQNNPWNEISQVSKFKTVNDCVNYLKQNKIIYNAQLDGMDLDSAKRVTYALVGIKSKFKFEPITIRLKKLGGATMQAVDGKYIEIDSGYFSKFDRHRYFENTNDKYVAKMKSSLKFINGQIVYFKEKQPNNTHVNKLIATQKSLEDKLSKFEKWTYGDEDTLTQDILIHELGHILNSQCTGGCSHRFVAKRDDDYLKHCDYLNKKRNEIFAKYIKETKCISEYSTVKPAEFFAECFAAYVHKDKKLPKYVSQFFDEYFKTTTPKI
jgi:hypothetical protein